MQPRGGTSGISSLCFCCFQYFLQEKHQPWKLVSKCTVLVSEFAVVNNASEWCLRRTQSVIRSKGTLWITLPSELFTDHNDLGVQTNLSWIFRVNPWWICSWSASRWRSVHSETVGLWVWALAGSAKTAKIDPLASLLGTQYSGLIGRLDPTVTPGHGNTAAYLSPSADDKSNVKDNFCVLNDTLTRRQTLQGCTHSSSSILHQSCPSALAAEQIQILRVIVSWLLLMSGD